MKNFNRDDFISKFSSIVRPYEWYFNTNNFDDKSVVIKSLNARFWEDIYIVDLEMVQFQDSISLFQLNQQELSYYALSIINSYFILTQKNMDEEIEVFDKKLIVQMLEEYFLSPDEFDYCWNPHKSYSQEQYKYLAELLPQMIDFLCKIEFKSTKNSCSYDENRKERLLKLYNKHWKPYLDN